MTHLIYTYTHVFLTPHYVVTIYSSTVTSSGYSFTWTLGFTAPWWISCFMLVPKPTGHAHRQADPLSFCFGNWFI